MQKNWQKLAADHSLWQKYFLREQIIDVIRRFFKKQFFHEIETPLLASSLPAESYLEIFETQLLDRQRQSQRAFLTTSPEVFLKKLLVAGVGNCFSITKSFRNTETNSHLHNIEFTILEWYRVGANYMDVMKDTQELILKIYHKLMLTNEVFAQETRNKLSQLNSPGHDDKIVYQNQVIDLSPPWEKLSMVEAFAKYAHIDLEKNLEEAEIKITAAQKGYQVTETSNWEELFDQIYLNEVEPKLGKGKPTFIYDFPSYMGALAKKKTSDPRFAERFELYIAGLELGDCYSELTDWEEQQHRFDNEMQEIRRLGKTEYPYDSEFIEALKLGLPTCSGLAMGVDRLIMLFADTQDIQDILLFPASQMWGV